MEEEFLSFIKIFVYNFKLCPFLPYCYIPDTYVSLFDGILMIKYEHLKIQFKTIISPPSLFRAPLLLQRVPDSLKDILLFFISTFSIYLFRKIPAFAGIFPLKRYGISPVPDHIVLIFKSVCYALSLHCFGNFKEAGNICSGNKVALHAVFFRGFGSIAVNVYHNAVKPLVNFF